MTAALEVTALALESDPAAVTAIRSMAAGSGIRLLGVISELPTFLALVGDKRPGVIIVDLAHAGPDAAATVRVILSSAPESCVVVTGIDASPAAISRAVSAGARGFILRPFEADALAATIRDAHGNLTELRRLQRGEPATARGQGTVIAVYSPKGGVGCTTIATNLAVALTSQSKRSVAIVDLDLQFGDVAVALDLRTANSVIDLIGHDELDESLFNDVFVRHASGVRALVAPEHLGSAETVDPDRVVRTLDKLRAHFDFVVCDLWSSLDDLSVGVLRMADRVVLVTTPELPSLRNVRRVMAATTVFGDDRTLVVLNRHPGKAGVSVADVERNLGRRVAATIPSDGVAVTGAINQGISMFDPRVRGRAGRSYAKLAEAIAHERTGAPIGEIAAARA